MKIIILRNFKPVPILCCLALIFTVAISLVLVHPSFAQTKNMADKDILKSKTIAIDPGHGGADPGAVGITESKEKDINLALSLKLQKYLQKNGATVVMTRKNDNVPSQTKKEDLDARAKLVKEANSNIFISMQCNAIPDPNCVGAQVFYYPQSKSGEILATEIQAALWEGTEQTKKREAQTISSPYILHAVEIPAVIVEAGFLSNPQEEGLLLDEKYQDKIVASVYKGIISYYKTKPTFLNF